MQKKLLPISAAVIFALHNPLSFAQTQENSAKSADDSELKVITVSGKYSIGQSVSTATGLGLTLQETPQ